MVIEADTSAEGLITTGGWEDDLIPRHGRIASTDADIVARLRAAGAGIAGGTGHWATPDQSPTSPS